MPTIEQFGPFQVTAILGIGATTIVHRATVQMEDGRREVALRRLHTGAANDTEHLREFVRGAKLAQQLLHPSIARVLEVARIRNTPYVAIELVPGRTIERIIASSEELPIDLVLSLLIELCEAIEYTVAMAGGTSARFGHLDASPYNLVVTEDGHLKVIDAAAIRPDSFSVAALAWGMLAGRRLVDGDEGERCDVLDEVIQDALDARPTARPSIRELRLAFDAIRRARRQSRLDRVWPRVEGTPAPRKPRGATTLLAIPKSRFARGSTPVPFDNRQTSPFGEPAVQRSRHRDSSR